MKPGDLVHFNHKGLEIEYSSIYNLDRNTYGILLEKTAPQNNSNSIYSFHTTWKILWGDKIIYIYESDLQTIKYDTR